MMQDAARRLLEGETVRLKVHGHSMLPYIRSGATVTLDPNVPVIPGCFALAKVHGRLMVHSVKATNHGRYLISNAAGHENGWTRQVFGVVTDIE